MSAGSGEGGRSKPDSAQLLEGVSKTAILTLRGRAEEHARPDRLFEDEFAVRWLEALAWPPELDAWYGKTRIQSLVAFRAHEVDVLTREAVERYEASSVVELGCGLSTRRERLRDLVVDRWIDVDLEGVIRTREQLGAQGTQVASSVLDDDWMDAVDPPPERLLLIAEGLVYYLPRLEVDRLFTRLRRRFPGALILLDVVGTADFETTRQNSASAGTPILWKVDGFDRAFFDFGIEIVAGWEPAVIMNRAIETYWPRMGKAAYLTIKTLSKLKGLADKRSGVMAGRLRPI